MTRAQILEDRRKKLGRAASYRALSKRTARALATLNVTLTEREAPFQFDRESVLDAIEDALAVIEAEQAELARAADERRRRRASTPA